MVVNQPYKRYNETLTRWKDKARHLYSKDVEEFLEKNFPNGIFSKDKDGDVHGINIMMRSGICCWVNQRIEEEKRKMKYDRKKGKRYKNAEKLEEFKRNWMAQLQGVHILPVEQPNVTFTNMQAMSPKRARFVKFHLHTTKP